MTDQEVVFLTKSPVELYKILKFENLAASGGEAKYLIADGLVRVNGAVETRKRKKIYPGDVVELNGICLEIRMAGAADPAGG
ncbi:MAG TPA: RNA-binding protein [Desulfobacteraceae bacterium]|nr:RNA-binding protein [Desulfobacteraceae bacterium]